MPTRLVAIVCLAWLVLFTGPARALTADEALGIASGSNDERITALQAALAASQGADAPALAAFVQALLAGELQVAGTRVLREQAGGFADVVSGERVPTPEGAEPVRLNNRMRGALQTALAGLQLSAPTLAERRAAVQALRRASPDEALLPTLERALAAETDAAQRDELERLRAAIWLGSPDRALRLRAAQALGASGQPAVAGLLRERLGSGSGAEADPEVRAALDEALARVQARLVWGERLGLLFTGLSLGSILLLAALGLAIIYGLMGVINMAHGELIMIGAYATYVVQNLFRAHLPGWFDWYILAAIPAAFLASAVVGAVLERGVIRWLYGRPLETLLATWGISLILIQAVRSLFGAQNVAVENPSWLSGGWQVLPNLILPYNRIAIGIFAALVLAGVALLIARTRLGLFVRGVTQNRRMAACVGIHTARVDTYAFALGAGTAGLAGCALSQVGNVGPDLGQAYIVDSFLVVVLGGVGQLAGTVYAGLGLGVLNKLLEGWQGAVLAKIMVLLFIIAFIQKRPQGIFALKGRSAEA